MPEHERADVDFDLDHGADEPRHRRKKSLSRRTRYRARLILTSTGARATGVILACVAVLLVGLLTSGFLSNPAPNVHVPAAALPGASAGGTSGSATASGNAAHGRHGSSATVGEVSQELHSTLPDNPLNHLTTAGEHTVVVRVTSARTIGRVGYFVPTGTTHTYGTASVHGRHWTVSQAALGSGYLAAVFVQAGASGTPISCSVLVDGKVTAHATTSGAYGRTVCLG